MKIGIDARMYSASFTGIGRYVYELTQHLFELNNDNEYVLFMNSPLYETFEPPNDRVRKVLVNARHYSWEEQVKFLKLLNKEKLDLMHFTHFNAPLLYRRPSVVTIHDLTLSFFPGKKMTSFIHRMAYHWVLSSVVKRSKHIIAVSKNTKNDLIKLLKTPDSKIEVIYEGVAKEFHQMEPPSIQPFLKTHGIIGEYLLYTGVWRSHKNLVNLLKAFALLLKKETFKGQLVITGRDDPFYPEVKETIQALNLQGSVILAGLVPEKDLIALYNGARVYVLPSFYEGFGLSPLESMACGTPVAASNTSCIPEICGEKNARFFDPKNPEDMANTIFSIWNDDSLQAMLKTNGLSRVQDFSWKTMTETTLKVYNKFLNEKN
jgi:glycosyltransferase involved in cell wall biosynthesis